MQVRNNGIKMKNNVRSSMIGNETMGLQRIDAAKITRPIQLLAAWLIGLIVVNGSFLAAAITLSSPAWTPALLVIASVINVPLFLLCIFLLQTKFRPEMQEDRYYSEYLSKQYEGKPQTPPAPVDRDKQNKELAEAIAREIRSPTINIQNSDLSKVESILSDAEVDKLALRAVYRSRSLSELQLMPHRWPKVVAKWGESKDMKRDIEVLETEGLITMRNDDMLTCELTPLGKKVAERAKEMGNLWNQKHPDRDPNEKI